MEWLVAQGFWIPCGQKVISYSLDAVWKRIWMVIGPLSMSLSHVVI